MDIIGRFGVSAIYTATGDSVSGETVYGQGDRVFRRAITTTSQAARSWLFDLPDTASSKTITIALPALTITYASPWDSTALVNTEGAPIILGSLDDIIGIDVNLYPDKLDEVADPPDDGTRGTTALVELLQSATVLWSATMKLVDVNSIDAAAKFGSEAMGAATSLRITVTASKKANIGLTLISK